MVSKPKNNTTVERHIFIPPDLDKRLVSYKQSKYNGLRAMNKVLNDCIRIGLAQLEKRG